MESGLEVEVRASGRQGDQEMKGGHLRETKLEHISSKRGQEGGFRIKDIA